MGTNVEVGTDRGVGAAVSVGTDGAGNTEVGWAVGCSVGDRMLGDDFGQLQSSRTNGRTMAAIAHAAMNVRMPTIKRKRF